MEKEKKSPGFADLSRGKKIIIISAAAFLCLVLILGAVLGTVSLVRRSRAVVSYKGVNMDEGVVNYLCMMAKLQLFQSEYRLLSAPAGEKRQGFLQDWKRCAQWRNCRFWEKELR